MSQTPLQRLATSTFGRLRNLKGCFLQLRWAFEANGMLDDVDGLDEAYLCLVARIKEDYEIKK